MKLERGSDQFFTTIGINGHDARMLLDTGSFENVLTTEAASRLRLQPDLDGKGSIVGVGGEEETARVLANDVRLGRMRGKRLRFATVPSLPAFHGDRPDGILGMNFLAGFDMDLDLPGQEIGLFTASGDCARPAVTLSGDLATTKLINTGRQFSPAIEVEVGGHFVRAVIDTGSQSSVIFSDAANTIGVVRAAGPRAARHVMRGFGSDVSASFSYVLPAMRIGGAALHDTKFEVLDHTAGNGTGLLLGADFLQRVHVWISRSSDTLVLQSPPRPSPPIPAAIPRASSAPS